MKIKLRAIGAKTKQWVQSDFSLSQDGKRIFLENGDIYNVPSDYIVTQWTGKKDWHGKDIYVGDIVYFEETNFLFNSIEEIKNVQMLYDFCWDRNVDYTHIKKLGNIYENKSLLKQ